MRMNIGAPRSVIKQALEQIAKAIPSSSDDCRAEARPTNPAFAGRNLFRQ